MGGTLPTIAPETLAEALEAAAGRGAELVFHGSDRPVRLPASTLLNEARRGAGALSALGLNRGEAVGILGPNRPEWARWAFATWLAGGVVVPLPYHLRNADRAASAHSLGSLLRAAGCRVALADPGLIGLLPPGSAIGWTIDLPARPGALAAPRPTDRAVVQFTSGSTATPKGVVLSHRAVLAGIRNPASDSGLEEHDRVQLSWLPFFHDWGLFGYLVWSIVMATETHILPTERFAKDPSEWFRLAGAVGAAMTPGPSSAWHAALKVACRRPQGVDLSSLRLCTLAAEMIDAGVVDRLRVEGAELGLDPAAVHGAYGLAETTLAVAGTGVGKPLRIDEVDRTALAEAGVATPSVSADARRIVSCGPPVPGAELRVVAPGGDDLGDRGVGEVFVRCPSLLDGYVSEAGPIDPLEDGWLPTGDIGYLADGELYVTGRAKDIVIVMGRNYSAHDIEWAAERAAGVRVGRCVAFCREGEEGQVVIAAEVNGGDPTDVPREVWRSVSDAIGVLPREVVVLPRGTIPLTTSGKLRRSWVRQADASGRLRALALAVGPADTRTGTP